MDKYDSSNRKAPKFLSIVLFEIRSFYGRFFKKNRIIPFKTTKTYIDFGFGANYTKGWINTDFFCHPKLKFWKSSKTSIKPDAELDLRYPILCADSVIDGAYSGHTLEHLYPLEAFSFLKEVYRILKPGAWLRITIPDLSKYVEYYTGKEVDNAFLKYKTGCEAIGALTQDWGHHSVWDANLLISTLKRIGFKNVKTVKYGVEGSDPALIKEEPARAWETSGIEAQR